MVFAPTAYKLSEFAPSDAWVPDLRKLSALDADGPRNVLFLRGGVIRDVVVLESVHGKLSVPWVSAQEWAIADAGLAKRLMDEFYPKLCAPPQMSLSAGAPKGPPETARTESPLAPGGQRTSPAGPSAGACAQLLTPTHAGRGSERPAPLLFCTPPPCSLTAARPRDAAESVTPTAGSLAAARAMTAPQVSSQGSSLTWQSAPPLLTTLSATRQHGAPAFNRSQTGPMRTVGQPTFAGMAWGNTSGSFMGGVTEQLHGTTAHGDGRVQGGLPRCPTYVAPRSTAAAAVEPPPRVGSAGSAQPSLNRMPSVQGPLDRTATARYWEESMGDDDDELPQGNVAGRLLRALSQPFPGDDLSNDGGTDARSTHSTEQPPPWLVNPKRVDKRGVCVTSVAVAVAQICGGGEGGVGLAARFIYEKKRRHGSEGNIAQGLTTGEEEFGDRFRKKIRKLATDALRGMRATNPGKPHRSATLCRILCRSF